RRRGRDGANDHGHFVLVNQLAGLECGLARVTGVVFDHELKLAAQHAAFGIPFGDRQLGPANLALSFRRIVAGERIDIADLDGLLAPAVSEDRRWSQGQNAGPEPCLEYLPSSHFAAHVVPLLVVRIADDEKFREMLKDPDADGPGTPHPVSGRAARYFWRIPESTAVLPLEKGLSPHNPRRQRRAPLKRDAPAIRPRRRMPHQCPKFKPDGMS